MAKRRTAQDRAALERLESWLRELGHDNPKMLHRISQRRVGVDFLLDAIAGLYERESIELRPWTDTDDLFTNNRVNVNDVFDFDDDEESEDEEDGIE